MTATNGLIVNGKVIYLIFLPVRSLYHSPMIPFSNLFFNPDYHQERLSNFVSSILGMQITVVEVLSMEDTLMDGESYLIMDLVTRTDDGSIVNVEIQKQGYDFPGQRMSCYASDLLLRQYIKAKRCPIILHTIFPIEDIKPVYVIVIFEHTTSELRLESYDYIHHGKTTFDTGLDLHMPERFCIIALDVFREIPYSEIKKCSQSAWLLLLSTEKLEDATRLIQDYPWMSPYFRKLPHCAADPRRCSICGQKLYCRWMKIPLNIKVERMQAENEKLKLKAEKSDAENESYVNKAKLTNPVSPNWNIYFRNHRINNAHCSNCQ